MLQNIRDNIQGTAAKVIIAIIIVPFALFGIDSLFNTSSQPPAASINGEKVSEAELQQAIAMQKRRLISVMGQQLDPAMLDDAVLRKPALDTLIKQQLLLQAADEAGIEVSDQQLNAVIAGMPQFQEDGRFSQDLYQQVLRLQGYSGALFKQMLRADLRIQQLSASVASSAFVTDADVDDAVAYLYETRGFHTVTVPLSKYENQVTVSEDELRDFYDANSARFQSQPKVKLSYLELNEEQFYQPVSEEQVQAEYENMVANLNTESEREAAHILLEINDEQSREQALEKLKDAEAKLMAGESFEALAKSLSEDVGSADDGGRLGFTRGDSFPPEFEEALASLEPAQVSEPVETEAGLHLIKLLSIKEADTPSLDSMRLEITERLRRQKAQPELTAAVETLRDLVFNAEDLSMPAKELGLEVKETDWLTEDADSELFSHERVKQAAFDAELRDQALNSDVFELSPERFLVIHVDAYQAPETLPFDEVKSDISAELKAEKAQALAVADAQEIEAAMAAGERAEAVAKARGLEWQASQSIRRTDISVEQDLRRFVFQMPLPEESGVSASTLHRQTGDYLVVQLRDHQAGQRAALDAETLASVRRSMNQNAASQAFASYFNILWNTAEISIN